MLCVGNFKKNFHLSLKANQLNPMFSRIFLIFCAFLPFQFALNPTEEIDLAVVRMIVLLFFAAIVCLAILERKTDVFRKDKMSILIVAFLLLAAISFFFSQDISRSLRKMLFLLSLFPVYFVALFFFSQKENTRKILAALVFGASLAAFVAIVQFAAQFFVGIDSVYAFFAKQASFFLGNSFSKTVLAHPSWLVNSSGITYMRAFAFFPDPHMFSYYMGMLIPFSIALWTTSSSYKKLFFVSSSLLIIADILSFTRGSYVALISGCLMALPFATKHAAKRLIFAATFLSILFFAIPHSPISQRFASSFNPDEGSNTERMNNWQQALSIIVANPMGIGIGNYSLAINPNVAYRTPIYAHNLYLDIAAELGVAAVAIFIAILYLTFSNFIKAGKENALFVAGISSMTIFAVHSLVETPLYSVHVLTLFLIIAAFAAASQKYEKTADN
jgi:O-antigen ligase